MKIMKKQSEVLQAAIDRLKCLADCNRDVMDADDYGDLQVTIKELIVMKNEASATEYRGQIQGFVDYLRDGVVEADGDEWHKWCQTPYVIQHGDKQVTIDNGSEVYEGFLKLLSDHLEEID